MRGRAWGLKPWVLRVFGHGFLGLELGVLAMGFWYGADQREIKETKSERTIGRERD